MGPQKAQVVQEGSSISSFQVLPLISCLICIPMQTSFLFIFWRRIYFCTSFTFSSLAGLVWNITHVLGEKHLYFWWLVGFFKSCLQLWLGGLFTLNLRSGEGAGSTRAGAPALGQSDQEQSLLFLHWTLGRWDASHAHTALEHQVSTARSCITVHIPPSHHSCTLNSSKQCLVVFLGNTTTESAENTFFYCFLS